jgi:hypothetical protein
VGEFVFRMATHRLKRPRDPIQLGKLIVDIATGQVEVSVGKKAVGLERKFYPLPSASKSHEQQLRLAGLSGSQPTKRSSRLPLDKLRKKRHSKRILPVPVLVDESRLRQCRKHLANMTWRERLS